MKNAGIVFFLALLVGAFPLTAQVKVCYGYTIGAKRSVLKDIKRSASPMIFNAGSIRVELRFNNMAEPRSLELTLTMKDNSKKPLDAGDLLKIGFSDGSVQEVIASGHKPSSGIVFFTLLQNEGNVMGKEARIFYEKLKSVNMSSLRISVSDHPADILIVPSRADSIRTTIDCLVDEQNPEKK